MEFYVGAYKMDGSMHLGEYPRGQVMMVMMAHLLRDFQENGGSVYFVGSTPREEARICSAREH